MVAVVIGLPEDEGRAVQDRIQRPPEALALAPAEGDGVGLQLPQQSRGPAGGLQPEQLVSPRAIGHKHREGLAGDGLKGGLRRTEGLAEVLEALRPAALFQEGLDAPGIGAEQVHHGGGGAAAG